MIYGKNMISKRFMPYALDENYSVFVGDIHDSTIVNPSEFASEAEEIERLINEFPNRFFVYFSSCSILDPSLQDSPYVKHKIAMEAKVSNLAPNFLVCRLPQVVGLNGEKSNLVDYLVEAIFTESEFDLWTHAERNLIDIDDVYEIVDEILRSNTLKNSIINVANPRSTTVEEIVSDIGVFLGIEPKFSRKDRVTKYEIDISKIESVIEDLDMAFGSDYFSSTLNKYFSHYLRPPKLLSVIVPTYNEEHGINEFYRRTKVVLDSLAPRFDYEIIFVNDYSRDNTYQKLQGLSKHDRKVKLINFTRNFGNQVAITAGVDYASGDLAVIIDDDLQDPPEIILNFLGHWSKGYKVVYGLRPKRHGTKLLFRVLAKFYYRLLSFLTEIDIPNDTGDFRLIDKVVMDELRTMREESRYYRGMVAWLGFRQKGCLYERDVRFAGVSTFSLKKYINFALNGLTSFTDKPLYFSCLAGFFITGFGFLMAIALIGMKILDPSTTIRGWTSLMALIVFFGGIQLFSIGLLGIYVGKVFRQVKGRPIYLVDKITNFKNTEIERRVFKEGKVNEEVPYFRNGRDEGIAEVHSSPEN